MAKIGTTSSNPDDKPDSYFLTAPSLIATCLHAGVNVLEYLVALQEHRAEVFAEPAAWLPWTYQAHLAPP
jgi:hypothetical protein